jgi:hypothetical protein
MKRTATSLIVAASLILSLAGCAVPTQLQPRPQSTPMRPNLELYYNIKEYDAHGRLVKNFSAPGHSYVQAMAGLLVALMSRAASPVTIPIVDTGGVSRAVIGSGTSGYYAFRCNAGAGVVTNGIVAGTGTNAVTESDNALQTLIAHGTGSGQLSYGAVGFTAPATAGSTTSFTISRTLTNSSAGSITIREIGLYAQGYYASTPGFFCIIRDTTNQTVASTHNVVITYTIAVSN